MLERLAESRLAAPATAEVKAVGPLSGRPEPHREVTPVEESELEASGLRKRRRDVAELSELGRKLAQEDPGGGDPAADVRGLRDEEARGRPAHAAQHDVTTRGNNAAHDAAALQGNTTGHEGAVEQAGSAAEPDSALSDEERERLAQLRQRDQAVRAHEQAHSAAGGSLTGSPSYGYEKGPDGAQYAVSGEVSINLSKGSTPDETIQIARQARAAALAPAQPSAQDRRVASEAQRMAAQAHAEKQEASATEETQSPSREVSDAIRAYETGAEPLIEEEGALSLFA